jgi:predicted RNA methylase
VVVSYAAVEGAFDAVVVTDLGAPQATFDAAAAILGPDRVLAPKLLGVRPRPRPRQEATA